MLNIISPSQFKQIPWKNGKGITTELAISDGGTLNDFDWRISIASVVEDGDFSDFKGYWRNLVLLTGDGIELTHDNNQLDNLVTPLAVASFDGGCATSGKLIDSPITDFNIMHKMGVYNTEVKTYTHTETIIINPSEFCFVYALNSSVNITDNQNNSTITLIKNHLLKMSSPANNQFTVCGNMMIIITFHQCV